MKKSLIAFAALAAVAGVAQAQSVTLYGILDAGLSYNSNSVVATGSAGSKLEASQGQLATSRFGLTGSEDLGGGNKAVFTLESGFKPTTGVSSQATVLFDRRANVGMSGNFGTLTMGRDTNAGYDYAGQGITDPLALAYDGYINDLADTTKFAGSQKINAVISVVSNTSAGTTRNEGSLKYTSPTVNGVQATVVYHPGGTAGSSTPKSAWSAGLKADLGVATLAYAHWSANDASSRSASYDSFGGTFNAGGVKFTAGYHDLKGDAGYSQGNLTVDTTKTIVGATASANGEYKVITVGAAYNFTPALKSTLAYNTGKVISGGNGLGKLNNTVFQNEYSVSKRTVAYATLAFTSVEAGVSTVTSSGQNATVVITGVKHTF